MEKQLAIWKLINRSLHQQVPVMLLYVLQSSGSSPGRQGFFMAVNAVGEMEGSIGGGIMEHKFVEMSKDKLRRNEQVLSVYHQIHDKHSAQNQSGMICSGEQWNFVYRLGEKDIQTVELIIETIESRRSGALRIIEDGIYFDDRTPPHDFFFEQIDEDQWRYEEKIGFKNNLYIIGAGHCALALSKIMRMMDFYIHLYDDRHPLNTFINNNYVHEKTIVNNYSQLKDIIPSGDYNYVVVMTMGYRSDDIVVRSLLKKRFKYFGLLGSSKKLEKMFDDYLAEGIDANKFKRIYAPVGLQINSQTPEEIAVSIAAEIINIKNEKSCN